MAGCLLGKESYIRGQFPGQSRIVLQLRQPSAVTLSLYVDRVQSAGTATQLTWFEGACRQRIDVKASGLELVQESEQQNVFSRTNNLYDVGDHLLEFSSDAQVQYLFKVEEVPLRNTLP